MPRWGSDIVSQKVNGHDETRTHRKNSISTLVQDGQLHHMTITTKSFR